MKFNGPHADCMKTIQYLEDSRDELLQACIYAHGVLKKHEDDIKAAGCINALEQAIAKTK